MMRVWGRRCRRCAGRPGSSDIQTLAFAPNGTLYGIHDALFTIDLATGQTTLVGSGGFDEVRGFVWVPGPGGIAIVGLLVLIGHRRRRSVNVFRR